MSLARRILRSDPLRDFLDFLVQLHLGWKHTDQWPGNDLCRMWKNKLPTASKHTQGKRAATIPAPLLGTGLGRQGRSERGHGDDKVAGYMQRAERPKDLGRKRKTIMMGIQGRFRTHCPQWERCVQKLSAPGSTFEEWLAEKVSVVLN